MSEPVELQTFGQDPETRAVVLRHLLSVIRTAARRRRRLPPPCVGCCDECRAVLPAHRLSCSHVKRWPMIDGDHG